MTNTIIVNSKANTLVITKAFAKAASIFSSDEYKALQEAKKDNPTYRVVIKAKKASDKSSDHNKGLKYSYMEKYIVAHDDEQKSIMKEYMGLRGLTKEAQALGIDSMDYSDIKNWFLDKFPEISEFLNQRLAVVEEVNKKIQAEKARKAELEAQSRGYIAA